MLNHYHLYNASRLSTASLPPSSFWFPLLLASLVSGRSYVRLATQKVLRNLKYTLTISPRLVQWAWKGIRLLWRELYLKSSMARFSLGLGRQANAPEVKTEVNDWTSKAAAILPIYCSTVPESLSETVERGLNGATPGTLSHTPSPLTYSFPSEKATGEEISSAFAELITAGEEDDLCPVDVTVSQRYRRGYTLTKGSAEDFNIEYATRHYAGSETPYPWIRYVHPEGAPYFWNPYKRVVTDADILSPDIRDTLEDHVKRIHKYAEEHKLAYVQQETTHLYIEHYPDNKPGPTFGYYFVDHTMGSLFWLDTKSGDYMIHELQTSSTTLNHLGVEIKSQYWKHNEYFPHLREVTEETVTELQDILFYVVGDLFTSSKSTIPYSLGEAKTMQGIVAEIAKYYRAHRQLGAGARTVVYRLLGQLFHYRFLDFYGEKHARLSCDQSVFGDRAQPTRLMSFISVTLFMLPRDYLEILQSVTVDRIVNDSLWKKLLGKLNDEWKEFALYGTVLLTSNVSFLAIQSLDNLGHSGYRSPAQRLSYVSIMFSIGTIILALLLVRQHKTAEQGFLADRSADRWGLQTLAVTYSLPYVFLMYAMLTFFLAFAMMCFQSRDIPTMIILAVGCFANLSLLWWVCTLRTHVSDDTRAWSEGKLAALKSWFSERIRGRRAKNEVSDA